MRAPETRSRHCLTLVGMTLLSFVWATPASATDLDKMRLVLKGGSYREQATKIDNPGLRQARETLKSWYPNEAESSNVWKLLDLLEANPGLRFQMAGAAAISKKKIYPIEIELEDHRQNNGRGVWPHVTKRDGQPVLHLGNKGIGGYSPGKLFITLLHEAGHLGDLSGCTSNGFGPDRRHNINEVISPAGAFAEGYAHYVAYRHFTRERVRSLGTPYVLKKYDRIMDATQGTRLNVENADGEEVRVFPRDLNLWYFVANESFVAGVLSDISKLLSASDRRIGGKLISSAIHASNGSSCRHLGEFLAVLIRGGRNLVPNLEESIREILSIRTLQIAQTEDVDVLLQGRLGQGLVASDPPFGRAYYPSEDGEEDVAPVHGLQTHSAVQMVGVYGF